MDLDPVEVRILGCLIEKQRTTPDTYPLSLNALRLACNQTTNRDPVVQYDETMIREALHRLSQRRFSRLASGHASRAYKFRHLLDEALELDRRSSPCSRVLMLRGAQTPGELKQRTDRMHGFADLAAVQDGARPAGRARARAAARAPAGAEGGALPCTGCPRTRRARRRSAQRRRRRRSPRRPRPPAPARRRRPRRPARGRARRAAQRAGRGARAARRAAHGAGLLGAIVVLRTARPSPAARQGPRRRALLRAARRRRPRRAPPASRRAHFSREFRRAFGESPHAYLLTRRLERAAALLRTTDRSVADDLLLRRAAERRLVHDELHAARTACRPTAYRAALPAGRRACARPGVRRARLRPPATPHVSRRQRRRARA